MAGQVMDHLHQARLHEASQLASEAMALIESLDPNLTVGLSLASIYARAKCAEWPEALRWSQMVIDLADGHPSKGNFIIGSPLALAFATRERPVIAWDFRDGATNCGTASPWPAAPTDVLRHRCHLLLLRATAGHAEGRPLRDGEIEDALRIAEQSGDDVASPSPG